MKAYVTFMRLAWIMGSVHCEVQIRPKKQVTSKTVAIYGSSIKKITCLLRETSKDTTAWRLWHKQKPERAAEIAPDLNKPSQAKTTGSITAFWCTEIFKRIKYTRHNSFTKRGPQWSLLIMDKSVTIPQYHITMGCWKQAL